MRDTEVFHEGQGALEEMTPYELGFITKCAEYGITKYAATALVKMLRKGKLSQSAMQRLADAGYGGDVQRLISENLGKHQVGKRIQKQVASARAARVGKPAPIYHNLAELFQDTKLPEESIKELRNIGVGDTHSMRMDKLLSAIRGVQTPKVPFKSNPNENFANYLEYLVKNEGLDPKRMKFVGLDTDMSGREGQTLGNYVRKMMGTSNTGTPQPTGAAKANTRLFTGSWETAPMYHSHLTGFHGPEYILRDKNGVPLTMGDVALPQLVREGLPQHIADIMDSRSKEGYVPGERTIRNYIQQKGLARVDKRPEWIRDAGGKLDDITHVRADMPYRSFTDSQRKWDGVGVTFRQSGARSRNAFASMYGKGEESRFDKGLRELVQEIKDPVVSDEWNSGRKMVRRSELPKPPVSTAVVPKQQPSLNATIVSAPQVIEKAPTPSTVPAIPKPTASVRSPASTPVPPKPIPTPSKPAVPKEVPKAVAPKSPVETQPTSWWKQEQEKLMKQRAEQAAMYAESADRHDSIAGEMQKQIKALSSNGVKRLLHRRDIAALKHKIMQQREFSRQAFLKSQRLKWAE